MHDTSREFTDVEQWEKDECEYSLYFFLRCAWKQLESVDFIEDWHPEHICDHLEAVNRGEILSLLINIPPGMMKSLICSVFYPVWVWINDPSEKFMTGSNSLQDLSVRDCMRSRTLIESDWFQKFWGDKVKFRDDQNQKGKYYIHGGGIRHAFSFDSKFIGMRANQIIIDDAMSYSEVMSKSIREGIITRYREGVLSRFDASKPEKIIIIGQRLHCEDLPGYLLKTDPDFYHLCIPMRYEVDSENGYPDDPRTKDGEILTKMLTEEQLQKKETKMGASAVAGQYQQRPVPKGGLIFKRDWINLYKELPDVKRWISSWDTAISEKKKADYTVGGLFAQCEKGYYLVRLFRGKIGFAQLIKEFKIFYQHQPVSAALVEAKASGQQLIQMLEKSEDGIHIPVISINPTTDKVFRAEIASPTVEAGKIFIREGQTWTADVIDELCMFPNATNDDITDIFTQLINWCNSNDAKRVRVYSL